MKYLGLETGELGRSFHNQSRVDDTMRLGGKEGVLNRRKGHNRLVAKVKSHEEVKEQKSQDGTNCPDLDDLGEWAVPFRRGSFRGKMSVRPIGCPSRNTKRQQLLGLDLRTEALEQSGI